MEVVLLLLVLCTYFVYLCVENKRKRAKNNDLLNYRRPKTKPNRALPPETSKPPATNVTEPISYIGKIRNLEMAEKKKGNVATFKDREYLFDGKEWIEVQ